MEIKRMNFLKKKLFVKHKLILSFIVDKNVVHFGCIDDSVDIIESKIKNNIYLHKLITEKSKKCIGIDINTSLIDFLKDKYLINNIAFGNVENPDTFNFDINILKETEVLVIADLIEHLNNPGQMLNGIKKCFSKKTKVLILIPNPFTYLNFAFTLLNREFYNIYHTCYLSTNNMKVLLSNNGFKINNVYPCFLPKDRGWLINSTDLVINHLLTIFTYGFCDDYLYECEIE